MVEVCRIQFLVAPLLQAEILPSVTMHYHDNGLHDPALLVGWGEVAIELINLNSSALACQKQAPWPEG